MVGVTCNQKCGSNEMADIFWICDDPCTASPTLHHLSDTESSQDIW